MSKNKSRAEVREARKRLFWLLTLAYPFILLLAVFVLVPLAQTNPIIGWPVLIIVIGGYIGILIYLNPDRYNRYR